LVVKKLHKSPRKIIFYFALLILFSLLGMKEGFSQSPLQEEKGPRIGIKNVTFQIREIESTTSPLRMLELHIEILNRSQRFLAPPNSVKVAVVPRETKYKDTNAVSEMAFFPEELTLNAPLPPQTGCVMLIGFSLPDEKLDSITFEVQINPPEGEKKMVTWGGN